MNYAGIDQLGTIEIAYAAVAAAAVSFALLLVLLRARFGRHVPDVPNERSLHETPTPRFGGVGIVAGIAASYVFVGASPLLSVGLLALGLAILSFCDDLWNLPVYVRLPGHLLAAIAVVFLFPNLWWLGVLGVLAIVWMTNLYNFMDGLDGLSGGMTAFGFLAYAIAAWHGDAPDIARLCIGVVGAAVGFLAFNYPPAKVFMGDVGAIPLGFLAGAIGYIGFGRGLWPIWFPALVFSPFIVDATITLFRRLARREKLWEAHRSHYYQRMALTGFGHAGTTGRWYVGMAAVAVFGIVFRTSPAPWVAAMLALTCVSYCVAFVWIDKISSRKPTS